MPKTSIHEPKRAEVMRLRIQDRLGAAEIGRRTGVPKSVLHYWLKGHPLTVQEKSAVLSAAPRHKTPKKQLLSDGGACELSEGLSTLSRGSVAENYVKYDIARHGLRIMNPDGDGDVVDMYVRRQGGERVAFLQVRMTSKPPARNGLPTISLRRYRNGKANNFKKGDFHFIVGFCPRNTKCYVYSYDEVSHLRNSVTITDDAAGAWSKVLEWLDDQPLDVATTRRKSASTRRSSGKRSSVSKRLAA